MPRAKVPKRRRLVLEETYEVERIVAVRGEGRAREYLVKWEGWEEKDNTWEPPSHLPKALILCFEEEQEGTEARAQRVEMEGVAEPDVKEEDDNEAQRARSCPAPQGAVSTSGAASGAASASGGSTRPPAANVGKFLRFARELMRRRVRVWWEEEGKWYAGVVREFDRVMERHAVLYDDGDVRRYDFTDPALVWEFEVAEGEAAQGADEPQPAAGDAGGHSGRALTKCGGEPSAKATGKRRRVGSCAPACGVEDATEAGDGGDGDGGWSESNAAHLVEEYKGVRLHLSTRSATGYTKVAYVPSSHRPEQPYALKGPGREGQNVAYFATAVEAALAYARIVGPSAASTAERTHPQALAPTDLAPPSAPLLSAPPPLAAPPSAAALSAAALSAAAAEGLELMRSDNATGYKGVACDPAYGRFTARFSSLSLGVFHTAEEAALAYARYVGTHGRGTAARSTATAVTLRTSLSPDGTVSVQLSTCLVPVDIVALSAAALSAAAAEGLELVCSDNAAGFKGVKYEATPGRFTARFSSSRLGVFKTPEEAALAYARYVNMLGPEANAGRSTAGRGSAGRGSAGRGTGTATAVTLRTLLSPDGSVSVQLGTCVAPVDIAALSAAALSAAAAEGLELVRSDNVTGFKGVTCDPAYSRFTARFGHCGSRLGVFKTPEEAALAYARHVRTLGTEASAGHRTASRGAGTAVTLRTLLSYDGTVSVQLSTRPAVGLVSATSLERQLRQMADSSGFAGAGSHDMEVADSHGTMADASSGRPKRKRTTTAATGSVELGADRWSLPSRHAASVWASMVSGRPADGTVDCAGAHAAEASDSSTWVQCERCLKWRRAMCERSALSQAVWYCALSSDLARASCDAPEEEWHGLEFDVGEGPARIRQPLKQRRRFLQSRVMRLHPSVGADYQATALPLGPRPRVASLRPPEAPTAASAVKPTVAPTAAPTVAPIATPATPTPTAILCMNPFSALPMATALSMVRHMNLLSQASGPPSLHSQSVLHLPPSGPPHGMLLPTAHHNLEAAIADCLFAPPPLTDNPLVDTASSSDALGMSIGAPAAASEPAAHEEEAASMAMGWDGEERNRAMRKRKHGCGQCAKCVQPDCGTCVECRDKPKFGGPNTRRKACLFRSCLQRTGSDTARDSSLPPPPARLSLAANGGAMSGAFSGAVKGAVVSGAVVNGAVVNGAVVNGAVKEAVREPTCSCGVNAVWQLGRWLCAAELRAAGSGCAFEHRPPPSRWTPVCDCGARACWEPLAERFLCPRPRSRGGCGFSAPLERETRDRASHVPLHAIVQEMAAQTAALLTAAAYGLGVHCFVAPCDVGLGLFARAPLRPEQRVVEYGGPRWPLSRLVHSTYALEIPNGCGTFIDGNYEHAAPSVRRAAARSPAIYTNHSRAPNCRLQHVASPHGPRGDTMWLVASEFIDAGAELRFDYEAGGSNYWQGFPPRESEWRTKRVAPPPPNGGE